MVAIFLSFFCKVDKNDSQVG